MFAHIYRSFLLWSLFISSVSFAGECSLGFPFPTWIETVQVKAAAEDQKRAKLELAQALKEKTDGYRTLCLDYNGEAFWYRPQKAKCQTQEEKASTPARILCTQLVEFECEAIDI